MELGRTLAAAVPATPEGEQLTSDAELADALDRSVADTGRRKISVPRPSIPRLTRTAVVLIVLGLALATGIFLYGGPFIERWVTSGLDVEAWRTELSDRAELTAARGAGSP